MLRGVDTQCRFSLISASFKCKKYELSGCDISNRYVVIERYSMSFRRLEIRFDQYHCSLAAVYFRRSCLDTPQFSIFASHAIARSGGISKPVKL